jgi:hypothetical protein
VDKFGLLEAIISIAALTLISGVVVAARLVRLIRCEK